MDVGRRLLPCLLGAAPAIPDAVGTMTSGVATAASAGAAVAGSAPNEATDLPGLVPDEAPVVPALGPKSFAYLQSSQQHAQGEGAEVKDALAFFGVTSLENFEELAASMRAETGLPELSWLTLLVYLCEAWPPETSTALFALFFVKRHVKKRSLLCVAKDLGA